MWVQIKCKYYKIEIHWTDSFYLTWMGGWMGVICCWQRWQWQLVLFYYFTMFGNMLACLFIHLGRHLFNIDSFYGIAIKRKLSWIKVWATACIHVSELCLVCECLREKSDFFGCILNTTFWPEIALHNPIIIIITIPFPGF